MISQMIFVGVSTLLTMAIAFPTATSNLLVAKHLGPKPQLSQQPYGPVALGPSKEESAKGDQPSAECSCQHQPQPQYPGYGEHTTGGPQYPSDIGSYYHPEHPYRPPMMFFIIAAPGGSGEDAQDESSNTNQESNVPEFKKEPSINHIFKRSVRH
ncbi:hypothetical protein LSTR_LSTR003430 [Laodelphax striatellus]|uniref:Uncharacterized protein n=1 Tax=Laodelphax striatellus TaxID=195883 RepID=A0A482X1P8_LAOST|nr:hypothetical protein LSTR_LSTR003430 [Laodelphax striatellus]